LALGGEEGRDELRKASVSCLISYDPEMSEWGNPLFREYVALNT
jgi:predicted transcriptional regulator